MPTRIWDSALQSATLSGAALCAVIACTPTTHAGTVNIGGGWQATWDASLDGLVNIGALGATSSTITISKSAIFTQGPVNGVFPSIPIVFQQIAESTITNIVIENEVIINNTGTGWSDFHFDLVGSIAAFNPTATANSGPNGFVVTPFTNSVFTPDNQRLDLDGGFIANGATWTPGSGATGGALWIDVTSAGIGKFFTLKETPTPGPTALAVIAFGVIMYTPRRRRDLALS